MFLRSHMPRRLADFLIAGGRSPLSEPSTSSALRVLRNTEPLYVERGWRLRGRVLEGYYRTRFGSFQGRIDDPFGASPEFLVINPPSVVLNGPHGPCFRQRHRRTFFIHWSRPPRDVNSGILRIEHLLLEALS